MYALIHRFIHWYDLNIPIYSTEMLMSMGAKCFMWFGKIEILYRTIDYHKMVDVLDLSNITMAKICRVMGFNLKRDRSVIGTSGVRASLFALLGLVALAVTHFWALGRTGLLQYPSNVVLHQAFSEAKSRMYLLEVNSTTLPKKCQQAARIADFPGK